MAPPPDELSVGDAQVRLRINHRARRISLSVSHVDGGAVLTLPRSATEADARLFLMRNAEWLRTALARTPTRVPITPGRQISFRGSAHLIRHEPGHRGRPEAAEGEIILGGPPEKAPAHLAVWLRDSARAELNHAVRRHAEALGARIGRVSVRDTRSRWGSCTASGNIAFSWRLILAPPDVLDYVAAHEAAHLLEMNHSDRFWTHVARLRPDYAELRRWLRENGAGLHRYRPI